MWWTPSYQRFHQSSHQSDHVTKRPKTNWFHVQNHPQSVIDQTSVSEVSGIALQHLKLDGPNVSDHSKYYESTPASLLARMASRPKPHLRFDKEFQDALDKICHRAHSDLLTLMIQQQGRNLVADNQAIEALQQQLKNLCPDPKTPSQHPVSTIRAAKKTRPRPRSTASTSTNNSQPDLATMQQKLTELHWASQNVRCI